MRIDFDSETPIYIQIAEEMEDAILSGAFPQESQVPSTTEISATYRINPATVLKGMALLTDEGVLYKKRGDVYKRQQFAVADLFVDLQFLTCYG